MDTLLKADKQRTDVRKAYRNKVLIASKTANTPTKKVDNGRPDRHIPLSRSASTSGVKPQRARKRSSMGM